MCAKTSTEKFAWDNPISRRTLEIQEADAQNNVQEATTQSLEESLMKVLRLEKEIVDHQNDKHDLRKQLKKMENKKINQREHVLRKCRVLWDALQRRDAEEDDDNLVDVSEQNLVVVEEDERR